MTGFVDLHCHWIWEIDDGARTEEEGAEMLRRLGALGFEHVVGTPHMRPGMFDNQVADLKAAYGRVQPIFADQGNFPQVSLGSEHFFDSEVISKVREGKGLPYRRKEEEAEAARQGGAILIEFRDLLPLSLIERQLFELQTDGYIPVIAHPERYRAVWESPESILRLVELGSVALLDVSALVGKYGRRSQTAAEELMDLGVYDAACTDSHRPEDVTLAGTAMELFEKRYGKEELLALFSSGPGELLDGKRPTFA